MDTSFLCGVLPRLLGDTLLPKKRRQPVSAVSASGSGCEGSEHFLQFRLTIHIGQDRSLLDGVVVLVEGEGAGDAVDGAGSDGVNDSLLVLVAACFQAGVLRSLQAVCCDLLYRGSQG